VVILASTLGGVATLLVLALATGCGGALLAAPCAAMEPAGDGCFGLAHRCLDPNAIEYDCANGEGDGPEYGSGLLGDGLGDDPSPTLDTTAIFAGQGSRSNPVGRARITNPGRHHTLR
jgi:hypothetical protein